MRKLDSYLNEIDMIRSERAREMSSLKMLFSGVARDSDVFGLHSKAVVVLCYAHWEGFYNDCARIFLQFLEESRLTVSNVKWSMMAGLLLPDLTRLRDKNHSHQAICEFIENLNSKLTENFSAFEKRMIGARSNLDYQKLVANFRVLGFEMESFESDRIRIDRELVGWRHKVAHGGSPDLSHEDMNQHIDFCVQLMLRMSDKFQSEIVEVAEKHFV
jgi:hypothetical protein